MNNNEDTWYKLDNAGKLFPSIANDRFTTVFRVSATLYEPVDVGLLQLALNHLMHRVSYYHVHLKRGFFWYYFEKTTTLPVIEKERYYPCIYLLFRQNGNFPFRVLYYDKKISLEVTHCLTDGTGAIIFLKSLLVEYFRLKGIESEENSNLLIPDQEIAKEEYEDAFKKYYKETKQKVPQLETAMHLPFPLTDLGMYHIVTGIMPVNKVLSISKNFGVTLTTFFLSLYFEAFFDFIDSVPTYLKAELLKPITMNIPVNLRSIFPLKTMRNFFLSITPTLNPKEGKLSFEKLMENMATQMKEGIKKENLAPFIFRNVESETSIFIRLLPLILKDTFMPLIYLLFGENGYTSSISNIGKITMPDPINEYVERFEFYPSPSRGNIIKTTMMSYKDKLYFTFGKLTKVTIIEKIFFRKLVKMGIPVKIEVNSY